MMNDRLVDQIVSAVLARLGGSPPARAAADGPSAPSAAVAGTNGPLVLDEAVVTAETLEQRLNGHARLTIGRRTVLTPSARDVLRAKGIEWSRGTGSNPAGSRTDAGTWLAIISRTTPAIEQLIAEYDQPAPADSVKTRRTVPIKIKYSKATTIANALKDVYRDLLSSRDREFDTGDKKAEGANQERVTVIRYGEGGDGDGGNKRPTPVKVGFEGALFSRGTAA